MEERKEESGGFKELNNATFDAIFQMQFMKIDQKSNFLATQFQI